MGELEGLGEWSHLAVGIWKAVTEGETEKELENGVTNQTGLGR